MCCVGTHLPYTLRFFSVQRLVKFSLGDEGVDTVEEALSQVQDLLDHYQLSSAEVILEIRADRVSLRDRNNQVDMKHNIQLLSALLL